MSLPTSILERNIYCNVATVCEDGSPWNTPLFFAFDNWKDIYWWSPVNAVHSQNILKEPRVFITVYDSQLPEGQGKGIYIQAQAKMLENEGQIKNAIKIYNDRSKVFKLSLNNSSGQAPTRIFEAQIERIWTNIDKEEKGYFIDSRKELA